MRISILFIIVLIFQCIASGGHAQSLQSSGAGKSPFKGGMNHITTKRSPAYYNKIAPAAGDESPTQSFTHKESLPRETPQSDLEKQVWAKYRSLTTKQASAAHVTKGGSNRLSIATQEDVDNVVKRQTLTTRAGKAQEKPGGISGLLQKYEERKAARARINTLGD